MSLNGHPGPEPFRPVLVVHVPKDGNIDAKRKMLRILDAAVGEAYGLPEFAIFLHEHSLDTVIINGQILGDDQQRVADQSKVYP